MTWRHGWFFALPAILVMALAIGAACGDDDDDDGELDSDGPAGGSSDDDSSSDDDATDDDLSSDVTVPADSDAWTGSGVRVFVGETLTVSASGTVTIGEVEDIGPAGADEACGDECAMPTQPLGALVIALETDSKVNMDCSAIYSDSFSTSITETGCDNGEVVFLVNAPSYDENSGSFEVSVEVAPVGSDDDAGDDDSGY
ncbi:hypothetical protein KDL45_10345 [bacterium]|nr:hypothetical protein [bacterium]